MYNFKIEFSKFIAEFYNEQFSKLKSHERDKVIQTLGASREILNEFLASDDIYITLPHASMNIFFPRAGVSRYVYELQNINKKAFHLRLFLTHTNFSDLNWRPYAWWFINSGKIEKFTFFTRNKKKKHTIVHSLNPGEVNAAHSITPFRNEFEVSMTFQNISLSFMFLTAFQEINSGFSHKGRTLYIPLDAYISFIIQKAKSDTMYFEVLNEFIRNADCRKIAGEELTSTHDWQEAFIFDNVTNISLLNFLRPTAFVGGAKMNNYWHQVVDKWNLSMQNNNGTDYIAPENIEIPFNSACLDMYGPSENIASELKKYNIPYSLTMAIQEHDLFINKS